MEWKRLQKSGIKIKARLSNLFLYENGVNVRFYENVKGIAPGQSAVFYEDDDVIGGGIIQRSINEGVRRLKFTVVRSGLLEFQLVRFVAKDFNHLI